MVVFKVRHHFSVPPFQLAAATLSRATLVRVHLLAATTVQSFWSETTRNIMPPLGTNGTVDSHLSLASSSILPLFAFYETFCFSFYTFLRVARFPSSRVFQVLKISRGEGGKEPINTFVFIRNSCISLLNIGITKGRGDRMEAVVVLILIGRTSGWSCAFDNTRLLDGTLSLSLSCRLILIYAQATEA